jgi:Asp-tRNA(Asn)/Glu-tRNA(Gln) amidotransferase A subunit family amidase
MKRRDLLVVGVQAAAAAPLGAIAAEQAEPAAALPAQVRGIEALRQLDLPRSLQPAVHFDPRLPGVEYPPQTNAVRLAGKSIPTLPASDADIAFAPVTDQSHWLRTGQISSLRLTEIYLERIARLAPKLRCYITVTADLARAQAAAMDAELKQGKIRGPLHGVPYSLKDTFDTKGIATTWGCALFRDRVPTEDAAITRMLRDAGAVLLGKAAMGELANGWEWFGGECLNPWNPEEPAGGSSSGSGAATAAGLCAFSIGTDNLGSILNPADRCGIVGLRPTFGRVPVRGAMPLTPSLERLGPLCRSVEDAALVLAAINGYDATSACSIDMGFHYDAAIDPSKLRIGYSSDWFGQVGFGTPQAKVAATAELAALQALRDIGVTLVPIELPKLPYLALLESLYVESAAVFDDLGLSGRDAQLVNRVGWPMNWRKARLLSAVDYLQLERFRRLVMQHMHELYSKVDMVFGPTYGSFEFFAIMNFTGHPGLTLRAGFAQSPTRSRSLEKFFAPENENGPLWTITRNVTFHGRLFEEGKMLALARTLEARLGVQARRPPVG